MKGSDSDLLRGPGENQEALSVLDRDSNPRLADVRYDRWNLTMSSHRSTTHSSVLKCSADRRVRAVTSLYRPNFALRLTPSFLSRKQLNKAAVWERSTCLDALVITRAWVMKLNSERCTGIRTHRTKRECEIQYRDNYMTIKITFWKVKYVF
jgi:hypothetical protein